MLSYLCLNTHLTRLKCFFLLVLLLLPSSTSKTAKNNWFPWHRYVRENVASQLSFLASSLSLAPVEHPLSCADTSVGTCSFK